MNVEAFLQKWRLVHLLPKFQEQNIDGIDIIKLLSKEEAGVFTKNVLGDKLKLIKAIESLHGDDENHDAPPAKRGREQGEDSEQAGTSQKTNNENPEASVFTCDTDLSQLPIYFVESANNTCLTSETASTVTITTTDSLVDILPGRSNELVGNLPIREFDVEKFLKNDVFGQALLNKEKREDGLSPVDRDRLAEIIIKYTINKFGKLTFDELDIIAHKVENIFPLEISGTYFVPPIHKRKSERQNSEKARGKLIDKQRNLLYLLKTLNKRNSSKELQEDNKADAEATDINQEAKDSHIWLKRNSEPHQDVLRHWKQSYLFRKLIHPKTIQDVLEEWPVLKTQLAPELIQLDCEKIHPTPENFDLSTEFDKLFDKALALRKSALTVADNSILELLAGEENITNDSKVAIKLFLLPALVPNKSRIVVRKTHWKPSVAESRNDLIVHVKHPGDIEEAKRNKTDVTYAKALTVQPYILLVGQSLSNVNAAFVVVNGIDYKCLSVLDALEFCFKIYQVLDAEYPFSARHLWYLVQWNIFKYYTKRDPKITYINDLLYN